MVRPFLQIDVFGERPLLGNPVAVVRGAEGLDDDALRRIARWTNLSETTFLLEPTSVEADYRVRIFTLAGELPFAGHPTLGTCHAWLEWGGTPRAAEVIVQECGVGLVPVRRTGASLAFAAPPRRRSGPADGELIAQLADVCQIATADVVAAEWVDNGPGWVALLLRDADAVLAVDADPSRWTREGELMLGLVGAHPAGGDAAWEVRALFGDGAGGLIEDPATGSLNASLGQWLLASGRARAPYVARQGTRIGRSGRVEVSQRDGEVWVGGATATVIRGEIVL